ncbi:hypothetical protein CLOP_g4406 [Closterium sp. NIES-67]|nr:hypothetical protein CLOP_g4406 [Closterium sp. NIES-67]
MEHSESREAGLCAAVACLQAQRLYIGVKRKLLWGGDSSVVHFCEAHLPEGCHLVLTQAGRRVKELIAGTGHSSSHGSASFGSGGGSGAGVAAAGGRRRSDEYLDKRQQQQQKQQQLLEAHSPEEEEDESEMELKRSISVGNELRNRRMRPTMHSSSSIGGGGGSGSAERSGGRAGGGGGGGGSGGAMGVTRHMRSRSIGGMFPLSGSSSTGSPGNSSSGGGGAAGAGSGGGSGYGGGGGGSMGRVFRRMSRKHSSSFSESEDETLPDQPCPVRTSSGGSDHRRLPYHLNLLGPGRRVASVAGSASGPAEDSDDPNHTRGSKPPPRPPRGSGRGSEMEEAEYEGEHGEDGELPSPGLVMRSRTTPCRRSSGAGGELEGAAAAGGTWSAAAGSGGSHGMGGPPPASPTLCSSSSLSAPRRSISRTLSRERRQQAAAVAGAGAAVTGTGGFQLTAAAAAVSGLAAPPPPPSSLPFHFSSLIIPPHPSSGSGVLITEDAYNDGDSDSSEPRPGTPRGETEKEARQLGSSRLGPNLPGGFGPSQGMEARQGGRGRHSRHMSWAGPDVMGGGGGGGGGRFRLSPGEAAGREGGIPRQGNSAFGAGGDSKSPRSLIPPGLPSPASAAPAVAHHPSFSSSSRPNIAEQVVALAGQWEMFSNRAGEQGGEGAAGGMAGAGNSGAGGAARLAQAPRRTVPKHFRAGSWDPGRLSLSDEDSFPENVRGGGGMAGAGKGAAGKRGGGGGGGSRTPPLPPEGSAAGGKGGGSFRKGMLRRKGSGEGIGGWIGGGGGGGGVGGGEGGGRGGGYGRGTDDGADADAYVDDVGSMGGTAPLRRALSSSSPGLSTSLLGLPGSAFERISGTEARHRLPKMPSSNGRLGEEARPGLLERGEEGGGGGAVGGQGGVGGGGGGEAGEGSMSGGSSSGSGLDMDMLLGELQQLRQEALAKQAAAQAQFCKDGESSNPLSTSSDLYPGGSCAPNSGHSHSHSRSNSHGNSKNTSETISRNATGLGSRPLSSGSQNNASSGSGDDAGSNMLRSALAAEGDLTDLSDFTHLHGRPGPMGHAVVNSSRKNGSGSGGRGYEEVWDDEDGGSEEQEEEGKRRGEGEGGGDLYPGVGGGGGGVHGDGGSSNATPPAVSNEPVAGNDDDDAVSSSSTSSFDSTEFVRKVTERARLAASASANAATAAAATAAAACNAVDGNHTPTDLSPNITSSSSIHPPPSHHSSLHALSLSDSLDPSSHSSSSDCRRFSLNQLLQSTDGFSNQNLLGRGAYGPVFRGQLFGCLVAIKKLEQGSDQGPAEFRTEVEVLSKVRHPHIVLLMGHCPEEACIVYEFLQGGNLQERIVRAGDNPPPPLPWHDRLRIISEISGALLYMHRHDPPILHRDLKPDNILLDGNAISKIADVGLARLIPNEVSAVTWKVRGTAGYIDPEEIQTGELSVKSDIYAFGLIALQLLTGLKNVKMVHGLLAACGTGARDTEQATDMVVKSLDRSAGRWPERLARRATRVLVRCIERRRVNRPDLGSEIHPLLLEIAEEAMEERNRRTKELDGRFVCPLSHEKMRDPVVAADGHTYEREYIETWIATSGVSPVTGQPLAHRALTPNFILASLMDSM